jgi:thymidine kinase
MQAATGRGRIEVILGSMFSGKTTEMQRRVRRYVHAHKCIVVIRPKKDTRATTSFKSHDDFEWPTDPTLIITVERLADADERIKDCDTIGIDEGQFFPDLDTTADKWAHAGKVVVVAALDGDFRRRPFGRVPDLISMAEYCEKLHAVCSYCFREASFSLRLVDVADTELIGGNERYAAVCRECHAKGQHQHQ